MHIKLAARKSDLARLQAYLVGQALQQAHPDLQIEYRFRASLGDKNLDDPLYTMGDKGVFTQDFVADLRSGEVDLVVHSWKDLPTEEREGLEIAATLPRADMRDVLFVRQQDWLAAVNSGHLKVLTSSPRRMEHLQALLPQILPAHFDQIEFVDVRGNVPTRFRKLMEGEAQALVVAKAAVDRLLEAEFEEFQQTKAQLSGMIAGCRFMVLPLQACPNAAAQGALAVEVQSANAKMKSLLQAVHDESTFRSVQKERELLAGYGGGCHQKIGVSLLPRDYGEVFCVRGQTTDGQRLKDWDLHRGENIDWPEASAEQIFPLKMSDNQWFSREPMEVSEEVPESDLLVARSGAWPQSWHQAEGVLWAAGLKTWRHLAAEGLWVHGCNESLGESELPDFSSWLGREMKWEKLTHDQAITGEDSVAMRPTYRLQPLPEAPNLSEKTHFYWTSGSAFLRALELYPQILGAYHGCGPGNSYRQLSQHIEDPRRLRIFLSHDHWLQSLLK